MVSAFLLSLILWRRPSLSYETWLYRIDFVMLKGSEVIQRNTVFYLLIKGGLRVVL